MPQLVLPIIAALGVGGTIEATMGGLQMAGVGQPNQEAMLRQQKAQLDQAKMDQARLDAESKRKAILAAMSNAQEQGGGALDEKGLTSLASIIAMLPGEATTNVGQGALSSYLGLPPTGVSGSPPGENLVSSTYGLSGTQG